MDFHFGPPLFPWPRGRGLRLPSPAAGPAGGLRPHARPAHPTLFGSSGGAGWKMDLVAAETAVTIANCPPHACSDLQRLLPVRLLAG